MNSKQTISLEQWRSESAERRARAAAIVACFPPAERRKPRDPVEAEFLRRIGTPERLIGPLA